MPVATSDADAADVELNKKQRNCKRNEALDLFYIPKELRSKSTVNLNMLQRRREIYEA